MLSLTPLPIKAVSLATADDLLVEVPAPEPVVDCVCAYIGTQADVTSNVVTNNCGSCFFNVFI